MMSEVINALLKNQVLFLVEGGDDVAFLQGFLNANGLKEGNIITVTNTLKQAEVRMVDNVSYIDLASSEGLPNLVKTVEELIKVLGNRIKTKGVYPKAVVILADSSNPQDETCISKIKTHLTESVFPCPDLNQMSNDPNSPIQFGLYVLKDLTGNEYNDLESIAIHTLKEDNFLKENVHYVLDKFRSGVEEKKIDISSKQSKRELAVCLATFPEYEGNPRPVLRKRFNDYFNIAHPAFAPLNTLLNNLQPFLTPQEA